MRKKGFSFFSRDDRLKTWNIPDIPIHEVHSPEIRRGLKVSLSAETATGKGRNASEEEAQSRVE